MGVYIPNMEKPKRCGLCRLCIWGGGYECAVLMKKNHFGEDCSQGSLYKDCEMEEIDLVRCGECAWYEKPYCRWHNIDNKPTDFCSYGERRNDD